MASSRASPSSKLADLLENSSRIEELSSASEGELSRDDQTWVLAANEEIVDDEQLSSSESENGYNVHGMLASKLLNTNIPALFALPPVLQDSLVTETSEKHAKVQNECLEILLNKDQAQEITDLNTHHLPHLQRQKHIKFLRQVLGPYPPPFQAMDASRPWLLYWGLAGLASLGVDVSVYKAQTIATFLPLQNTTGGFGGGHGQLSHCAAGYAAVLSLAMVGGLEIVDRRTMWQWLGRVKQEDGSFRMAVGGEKDVRGAYCGMTIHTLLNLPLVLPPDSPAAKAGRATFTDGLGEWFGRCQTYEGGIGGAPDNEAHGAYAFCCLAGLSLLDAPDRSIPTYLDVPRLVSWLTSRQEAPEGSFAGRTNKLVDACYSHWVGGCWALLEAAVFKGEKKEGVKNLWNREGLVRYTLSCSQSKRGGLRDKPGTRPDGYHTCYSLAGLSAAQNHYYYDHEQQSSKLEGGLEVRTRLTAAFKWRAERPTLQEMKSWCFDKEDLVNFVHPVFVIPMHVVEKTREQFEHAIGF